MPATNYVKKVFEAMLDHSHDHYVMGHFSAEKRGDEIVFKSYATIVALADMSTRSVQIDRRFFSKTTKRQLDDLEWSFQSHRFEIIPVQEQLK